MSRRPRNFRIPLKNITSSFNASNNGDNSSFFNLSNSPMSNLTYNLSELSTGRNTPRRKLTLTCADTPPCTTERFSTESPVTVQSGFNWSPTADFSLDSNSSSSASTPGIYNEIDGTFTFYSEQTVGEHGNKLYVDDACSQDSGLGMDHERRDSASSLEDTRSIFSSSSSSSSSHLDRLPSLEEVWTTMDLPSFKTPKGMPPKRSRSLTENKQFSEETCSPIKYSPVKSSFLRRQSFSENLFFSRIPEALNETTEAVVSEVDDGFQELFKLDDLKNEADSQMSSLISAKLLHRPCEQKPDQLASEHTSKKVLLLFGTEGDTPSGRGTVARRGLHRSQSLDIRPRPSSKRYDPPSDSTNHIQNKKWKGENVMPTNLSDENLDDLSGDVILPARRLQRCHSETEAMIKSAISRMYSEPDLIGDCSKSYCLPTVTGRHQDLKSISSETLSHLITGDFSDVIDNYHIIDCRYPYEYEGGHIQNAVNIYTREGMADKFIKSPLLIKNPNKRMILIFHCEFSSERGPNLFRFLRQQDRETNKDHYPFLHYPEMYLLEGGYKNFFEHFSHLCEPRQYKTMFDKNHMEDLRKFRAKCRSWSDDKIQHKAGVRNLKF